ncbi:enterotoxin A family protein [Xenorhabdus bharatensis]|uniref:enterotoxin A family protein n=1 Tax=Xenorhabdus bharatensis TaxID=3136256 RepID=UPI0030F3B7CF
MKILKFLTLLCILFLYTVQSYAQQPINHLYRMDTRTPIEIFGPIGRGFVSWGTNDDIVEHIQDYSVSTQGRAAGSAFISTSVEREYVIEWGVDMDLRSPFYIYDIRPTVNFYSVVRSLTRLYEITRNENYFHLISDYQEQQEYVAVGNIPVTQIRGAWEFLYDAINNEYVEGSYIENMAYHDDTTRPNTEPYIQRSPLSGEVIEPSTSCAFYRTSHNHSAHTLIRTNKYPFLKELILCRKILTEISPLSIYVME